jgi:hypothetical protein
MLEDGDDDVLILALPPHVGALKLIQTFLAFLDDPLAEPMRFVWRAKSLCPEELPSIGVFRALANQALLIKQITRASARQLTF